MLNSPVRGCPASLAGVALVCAATSLACTGIYVYGSFGATLAALRGHAVYVEHATKSLGATKVGCRREVEFLLTNVLNRPVRVVNLESACSCTSSVHLPVAIAPRGSRTVVVSVQPQIAGRLEQPIGLQIDVLDHPIVRLRVVGEVEP